jgi:hypothetical protein
MRIFGTDSNDNVRVIIDANIEENKVKVPTQATSTNDNSVATTAYVKNILSELYPVGAIYIGTQATCPLATLISGSTWVLVSEGRVLQGADSGHAAGTTINAGLPNITGNLRGVQGGPSAAYNWGFGTNSDGVFSVTQNLTKYNRYAGEYDQVNGNVANFDASRSSAIYGNSTTVQPPAYVVNIWRRTA